MTKFCEIFCGSFCKSSSNFILIAVDVVSVLLYMYVISNFTKSVKICIPPSSGLLRGVRRFGAVVSGVPIGPFF